jgi:hypothetical protein
MQRASSSDLHRSEAVDAMHRKMKSAWPGRLLLTCLLLLVTVGQGCGGSTPPPPPLGCDVEGDASLVVPMLECVATAADARMYAVWGYNNTGSGTVTIPAGLNGLPRNRGCAAGRVDAKPRQGERPAPNGADHSPFLRAGKAGPDSVGRTLRARSKFGGPGCGMQRGNQWPLYSREAARIAGRLGEGKRRCQASPRDRTWRRNR